MTASLRKTLLTGFITRHWNSDIQTERIAEIGDPVVVIGKIVRHENIGIVFASTRREDIEKRFYTGTVARSLSLKLTCSVALVRVVHSGRVHPERILVPVKARIDHVTERACFATHMARVQQEEDRAKGGPKIAAGGMM